jgi:hypothetical protein
MECGSIILGNPSRAINLSCNTTGKLAGWVEFDRMFAGDEPSDQRSQILEYSVREISPGVDLPA